MTFAERTGSALRWEAVLICASLPLMKVLWTDNVCLVRRQEPLMESVMSTVWSGWWSEYIYDKLKGENIAVNGGSGVMSTAESVGSLWPKIDESVCSKRWDPAVGVYNFLPSVYIEKKRQYLTPACQSLFPPTIILLLSGCIMHPDKCNNAYLMQMTQLLSVAQSKAMVGC